MKKKTVKPKPQKLVPYLDYMCEIGQVVQWKDLSGKTHTGKLIAMDEDFLASIQLDDGTIVQYQC